MTLLTLCVAAADEIGVPRPTSVVGNAEPDVQSILRYANRAGIRLMRAFPWAVLRKELTFTSVATETQTGILPSDFDHMISETFWNRTDKILITGPSPASEWQGLKASIYSDVHLPKWTRRGNNILVQPTLTGGKTLAFEYVSNLWCESSGGTAQAAWADDTDVGILDEDLLTASVKYIYLSDKGLPNQVAALEFNDYFRQVTRNEQPTSQVLSAGDIFGGRHFRGAPPSISSVEFA